MGGANIHSWIRYKCDECDHAASTPSHLKRHKRTRHEGLKYSCDQCEFVTSSKKILKEHQKIVHEGFKYSCDSCDFEALKKSELKHHEESVHGVPKDSEGRFQCNLCPKSFPQGCKLRDHKLFVHEGVKFNCKQCDFKEGLPTL